MNPSIFARPPIIFGLVWALVFIQFFLISVKKEIEIKIETTTLVFLSILGSFIAEKLFQRKYAVVRVALINFSGLVSFKRLFTKIWVVGILATMAIQGGFPLLWKFIGDPRGYADFGIPTLNGGLVAIYIILNILTFRDYVLSRQRKDAVKLLLLFSYNIITMNRGLMVYLILNLICVYLFFKSVSIKRFFILAAFACGFIYLLNFIAENRSNQDQTIIRNYIAGSTEKHFEEGVFGDFQRGLHWLEIYSSAPIANLNFNIDNIEPSYVPKHVFVGIFPSIVRDLIFGLSDKSYEDRYSLEMVDSAFNTFTFYASYLKDFGFSGCAGILVLVHSLANRFYQLALSGRVGYSVGYCGIFAAIVLSPFTDFFGTLVLPAQLLIGVWLARRNI